MKMIKRGLVLWMLGMIFLYTSKNVNADVILEEPNTEISNEVKEFKPQGHRVVLWTYPNSGEIEKIVKNSKDIEQIKLTKVYTDSELSSWGYGKVGNKYGGWINLDNQEKEDIPKDSTLKKKDFLKSYSKESGFGWKYEEIVLVLGTLTVMGIAWKGISRKKK